MSILNWIFGGGDSTQSVDLRSLTADERQLEQALYQQIFGALARMNPAARDRAIQDLTEQIYASMASSIQEGASARAGKEDATMARRGLLSSSEQVAKSRVREADTAKAQGEAKVSSRLAAEDIGLREAALNLQGLGGAQSLLNSLQNWQFQTSQRTVTQPSQGLLGAAMPFLGYQAFRPGGWLNQGNTAGTTGAAGMPSIPILQADYFAHLY